MSILKKPKLIRETGSTYTLTDEGVRRLSELGITESEAVELTDKRENLIKSTLGNDL